MRKVLAFIFIFFPLLLSAQENFLINVSLKPNNSAKTAILSYKIAALNFTDTAIIKNGKFSFSGKIQYPVSGYISIAAIDGSKGTRPDLLNLFIENKTIEINAKDSLRYAIISGSQASIDQLKLIQSVESLKSELNMLNKEHLKRFAEKRLDTGFSRFYDDDMERIKSAIAKKYLHFIHENKNSYITLEAIKTLLNDAKQESLEKDFASLPEALKNSFVGLQVKEKIKQINSLQLGSPFINFIQNDSNGKSLNLSHYLGNYILLEFWASWCIPCREQNPALVKVYQKFRDKKFKIIGIALEAPMAKKKWLKAIKDDQLEWDQVTDFRYWDNELAKLYNVQQIPFNYLISPEGKIIGKNLDISELEQKLNLYLSDLPPFVRP